MSQIRFSIVIACYNQRHFVQAAVESAISQPYIAKEIIVVDDASTDGTPEVLETFGNSIQLVRFRTNQGASVARNHAASLATGEYLVFLDGDDVFIPWTLHVYNRLVEAESPKIILGQRCYFRGEAPPSPPKDMPRTIHFVNYPCWFKKDRTVPFGASNLVVSRNTFCEAGGWSREIFHLDIADLLLKLGLSGKTLVILAPETVWYRIHSANTVNSIPPFLECSHVVLMKEKAGAYPGGRKYFLARSTCLAGPILCWLHRGLRAGLYKDSLRLASSAWFTIFLATVRRFVALCRGRHPVQSLELSHD